MNSPHFSRLSAIMLFLALAATSTLTGCSRTSKSGLYNGAPAPDFSLYALSGDTVTLSLFQGKSNVLLHFGTTWCPPCRDQVDTLNALDEKYTDDELVVISVDSGEPPQTVAKMITDEKATYLALLDMDGRVANAYYIVTIPLNVLVDKEGRVAAQPSNPIPLEAITRLVGR